MKKINVFKLIFVLFLLNSMVIKAQTTYKDVAHIFYSRCTSCHHEGQHAPSMMNYSEIVQNFSLSTISSYLQTGYMPPWSPDTSYSRFQHERIITTAEKNDIINWINNGALKGDTTLAPTPPTYSQYKLQGTPDLVLQIPTFTSNASSSDSYVCFSLPTNLSQDRILRAYEVVPGNAAIVHHVVIRADTMGTSVNDLTGGCYNASGDFSIGGYAPGAAPTVFPGEFPLKAGIRIPANSKMILQIHYPIGSAGLKDSTQIRMYFYPIGTTGIRPIYTVVPLQNWSLSIPQNTVKPFSAQFPVSANVSIFATFPHSHGVCKSIVNYAYSGVDTIPLIRINNWDFNWQGFYTFRKLVKIPNGYTLFSKHIYDNTTNNPNNPNNPPQNVFAGLSTADEMLYDAIQFLFYESGDELIDVEGILANDPLLNSVNENTTISSEFQALIFPNPAADQVNIRLSKRSEYKVKLYSITGQTIATTETFDNETTVDLKNISTGFYFIEVTDLKNNQREVQKIAITK